MVLPTLLSACVSVAPYIEQTVVQACALCGGVLTGNFFEWLPSLGCQCSTASVILQSSYGGCLKVSNSLEFTSYQFILLATGSYVNAYCFFSVVHYNCYSF